MNKSEAIKMIDDHKNKLVNPVEMLHWTWLRVIILSIPDDDWNRYVNSAAEVMSQ